MITVTRMEIRLILFLDLPNNNQDYKDEKDNEHTDPTCNIPKDNDKDIIYDKDYDHAAPTCNLPRLSSPE